MGAGTLASCLTMARSIQAGGETQDTAEIANLQKLINLSAQYLDAGGEVNHYPLGHACPSGIYPGGRGSQKNEATERDLTNGRAWGHSVAWAFIVLCHALQCLDVLGLALILSKA